MKKKGLFLIALIFLIFSVSSAEIDKAGIPGGVITGETITGEATQNLNINISVIAYFPRLTILSPKNKTYLTNESLLLNYSVSSEQAVWYNLDNLDNITITSPITFNTSQGSHTLYVYANSTYGNITARNLTFLINSTRFTIIDNEYEIGDGGDTQRKNKKGGSTDFFDYSYEEMQNLSNVILDSPGYGKIQFNQLINLTNDEDPTDNILNIDSYTNLSSNRIEINSNALPNFNKKATLWLYNLNFTNPRILKDGSVCPSTICTQENYSGGTLKFNVTGFSVYSAEETPTIETPAPPSGGGGGGGGGGGAVKSFTIDKKEIKVKLKQGETKKEEIIIKNTGIEKIKINLDAPELENFLKISEKSFELEPGKSKTIIIDFIAREETLPELYIGKIIFDGEGVKKEILVAIEVESKKSMFDIKVSIPKKFQQVMPGEEIMVEIKLYNLGEIKRADVELEYYIKDEENKLILSSKETLAVETQASFVKTFQLPSGIEYGRYVIYVKIIYDGDVASASEWFSVGKAVETPFTRKNTIIIVILIAIIILFVVLYELRKRKQRVAHIKIDGDVLAEEKLIKIDKKPKIELYYE